MANSPDDDKRYTREELDQSLPKRDHDAPDDRDDDVQRPDGDNDGMTPVRQTERRQDRATDDGMKPADRPGETTGL
jgi:hypothetical protein